MSGSTDHLPRLLALVPWLLAHPDTPVGDVAARFGVDETQIRKDLDLLWMCGLPGHGPGDLMDVVYDGDRVSLSNADTIGAPLRLTTEEALALVAALRALAGVPGLVDTGAVDRALAKLEAAAGDRLVTLELAPAARWVADYYPHESVDERPDGGLTVTLRARDDAWLRRLALGLAGLGRVVEPAELAAAVRDEAQLALAAYE